MTTWAFIPARGGSVRIPDKNLQTIDLEHGYPMPLVSIAVECARDGGADSVVLSTDDRRISHAVGAESWHHRDLRHVVHERPANLAGPHAQIEDAILEWGGSTKIADDDVICLLQCTSPFRRPETIRACVDAVRSDKAPCAVTVVRDERWPFTGCVWPDEVAGTNQVRWEAWWGDERPRSQDLDRCNVTECGSCWAFTWRHIRETGNRTMDGAYPVLVDWLEAFEIDTFDQLEAARALAPYVDRIREAMCTC